MRSCLIELLAGDDARHLEQPSSSVFVCFFSGLGFAGLSSCGLGFGGQEPQRTISPELRGPAFKGCFGLEAQRRGLQSQAVPYPHEISRPGWYSSRFRPQASGD